MSKSRNRQPKGITSGGEFTVTVHETSPVVLRTEPGAVPEMTGRRLMLRGYMAVSEVHALMENSAAAGAGDGKGMHLLVDHHTRGDDCLRAGCPTGETGSPDAKWYVESADGSFRRDHPDFGCDADPDAVATWIREMALAYEAEKP